MIFEAKKTSTQTTENLFSIIQKSSIFKNDYLLERKSTTNIFAVDRQKPPGKILKAGVETTTRHPKGSVLK
jgi:hypothetical protein